MRFFYAGRLGTTILEMPLYGLKMIVEHSPPMEPWLKGESGHEITKRIALLEGRDYDTVAAEVKSIRSIVDAREPKPAMPQQFVFTPFVPPDANANRWVDVEYSH